MKDITKTEIKTQDLMTILDLLYDYDTNLKLSLYEKREDLEKYKDNDFVIDMIKDDIAGEEANLEKVSNTIELIRALILDVK